MSKIKQLFWALMALIFFNFGQCKKKKDELPPETQTGANTFGCLVNGQVFLPGGAQLSGGSLQCNYQYLGSRANGGHYFVLSGRNQTSGNPLRSVSLYTDSLQLAENIKLTLKNRIKGNASGRYFGPQTDINIATYVTNENLYIGELWIKKLDTLNQIVSGTFWFDAVNSNNKKVEIRQGRFDVRYTR
ncbi:MAG: hypothetical protein ACT4OJ_05115 [Bacteroidota bacterium]